jgi:hypothetical protein
MFTCDEPIDLLNHFEATLTAKFDVVGHKIFKMRRNFKWTKKRKNKWRTLLDFCYAFLGILETVG